MIVVSDTSPLNYLILIECIGVLPSLFGEVVTVPAVIEEMQDGRADPRVREWARCPPAWLAVRAPSTSTAPSDLGPGESQAISLAEDLAKAVPDVRLLIDERYGTRAARERGLVVISTLIVLESAAMRGLIDLHATITRLRGTSFYVREETIKNVLDRFERWRTEYTS